MKRWASFLSAVLAGIIASTGALAAYPLECGLKIPADLQPVLAKHEPGFRLPRLADLDAKSIDDALTDGGDGCFAVAAGRFRGKDEQDIALLLAPISGTAPRLVVAVRRGQVWLIHRLPTYCEQIAYCYVAAGKPGKYDRTLAIPNPPSENDDSDTLTSRNEVILSGRLESTGVAYAYLRRRWRHVWISD